MTINKKKKTAFLTESDCINDIQIAGEMPEKTRLKWAEKSF